MRSLDVAVQTDAHHVHRAALRQIHADRGLGIDRQCGEVNATWRRDPIQFEELGIRRIEPQAPRHRFVGLAVRRAVMPGVKRPAVGPPRDQVEDGGVGGVGEGLQPEKARPCIDQTRSIGESRGDRLLQTVGHPEPRYRQNHEAGPLQRRVIALRTSAA